MEHIKDCTNFFSKLDSDVRNSPDIAMKIEIVERTHIKVNQEVALLKEEMQVFQEILADRRVKDNIQLYQYLSVCLVQYDFFRPYC